jgi:hypothetical protein
LTGSWRIPSLIARSSIWAPSKRYKEGCSSRRGRHSRYSSWTTRSCCWISPTLRREISLLAKSFASERTSAKIWSTTPLWTPNGSWRRRNWPSSGRIGK